MPETALADEAIATSADVYVRRRLSGPEIHREMDRLSHPR
jgi:hypothetical protein